MGPRAQATTAGNSSTTTTSASCGSSASAARRVKPMPSPPIRIRGRDRPRIRSHDSAASAFSDPLSRLFISSIGPDMIESSAPRCMRRRSPPPGIRAAPSWVQGIMRRPARTPPRSVRASSAGTRPAPGRRAAPARRSGRGAAPPRGCPRPRTCGAPDGSGLR